LDGHWALTLVKLKIIITKNINLNFIELIFNYILNEINNNV
jgi:hypothetical protein